MLAEGLTTEAATAKVLIAVLVKSDSKLSLEVIDAIVTNFVQEVIILAVTITPKDADKIINDATLTGVVADEYALAAAITGGGDPTVVTAPVAAGTEQADAQAAAEAPLHLNLMIQNIL
jgi:hypothetical protein